jgi:hypothetical protein
MSRSLESAVAACRREVMRPQRNWTGLCLQFVRTMWSVDARHPSAITAWRAIPEGEWDRGAAPEGAILYWAVGKHGHCAISLGSGWCVSTDLRRTGKPDAIPTALVAKQWSAELLGWSRWLNGVKLPGG